MTDPTPERLALLLDDDLVTLCMDSGLSDISFTSMDVRGREWLEVCARTIGPDDEVWDYRVWAGPDFEGNDEDDEIRVVINDDHFVYEADDPDYEVAVEGLSEDDRYGVLDDIDKLYEIHVSAARMLATVLANAREGVVEVANQMAARAGSLEDDDEEISTWEDGLEAFGQMCRLDGMLSGVEVARSPNLLQSIDISGDAVHWKLPEPLKLRIWWDRGADGTAVHWISAGDQRWEAHAEMDLGFLLPDLDNEIKGYIAHLLGHLHDLSHLVELVCRLRCEAAAEEIHGTGLELDAAAEEVRKAEADVLAAMNAMARAYTGRPAT